MLCKLLSTTIIMYTKAKIIIIISLEQNYPALMHNHAYFYVWSVTRPGSLEKENVLWTYTPILEHTYMGSQE